MWFTDATCFDALLAPTAERKVSASTVIFDLSGCRLSGIWKDSVGGAPLITIFSVIVANGFGIVNLCACNSYFAPMAVGNAIAELVRGVLLVQLLQPSIGREDHLFRSCWWS